MTVPINLPLDGKVYLADPLTDDGYRELDKWIRQRYLEENYAVLPEKSEDKKLAMEIIQKTASTLSFFSAEGARLLATVEGMSKLVSILTRKNHPELTQDFVSALLRKPYNVRAVNAVMRQTVEEAKKSPSDGDPSQVARQQYQRRRKNQRSRNGKRRGPKNTK